MNESQNIVCIHSRLDLAHERMLVAWEGVLKTKHDQEVIGKGIILTIEL